MNLGIYTNIKEGFKYVNLTENFNDMDGRTYVNIYNLSNIQLQLSLITVLRGVQMKCWRKKYAKEPHKSGNEIKI
jgi:hypothetical protein